jgi:sortase A
VLKVKIKKKKGLKGFIKISHYKYKKPNRKTFLIFTSIILWVVIIVYLFLLIVAPEINYYLKNNNDLNIEELDSETIAAMPNTLVISKLKLQEEIYEGDKTVLDKGIWHRKPDLGDPKQGGNFILTGHRFSLGLTPGQTASESLLYHIDKLKTGDEIFIVWNKKLYKYEIVKIYNAEPTQIEVEAQSSEHKLTLYTCMLGGKWEGRVVIEAEMVSRSN